MKVLLVSHNPIATYNNMGKTLQSLFSNFKKEEICQLYVYPSIPDVDACNSYYRITDMDVLKGIFRFRVKGREIEQELVASEKAKEFENENDTMIYGKRKNDAAIRRLLRDALWKMSSWYTKELEEWIDRENPTCIFVAIGYAKFIYDVAMKIAQKRNIPIITYVCDDYYFVKTPESLTGKIYLSLLKKKTDELLKKTSRLVVICEELKEIYEKHFSVDTITVMTGSNYEIEKEKEPVITKRPRKISYFGNIRCNRHRTMAALGREIDEINHRNGTDFEIHLYTNESDPQVLEEFRTIESVKFHDFLQGEAFRNTMLSSEVLMHLEDFSEESIDLVKHSVSTKIADSLASGIPLFAYGPKQVASIKHLIRNKCAVVADKDNLEETLLNKLSDSEYMRNIAVKGLETAARFHDSNISSQQIKNMVEKL